MNNKIIKSGFFANYFLGLSCIVIIGGYKYLFYSALKGTFLSITSVFLSLYISITMRHFFRLYKSNKNITFSDLSLIIIFHVILVISATELLQYHLLLVYLLKMVFSLTVLVNGETVLLMADSSESMSGNVNLGAESSTAGSGIPITKEENNTLDKHISQIRESVNHFISSKNQRDTYRSEGMRPLADFMQTFMNSCKSRIHKQLNETIEFQMNLVEKYKRSNEITNYLDSKGQSTQSLATRIAVDEED